LNFISSVGLHKDAGFSTVTSFANGESAAGGSSDALKTKIYFSNIILKKFILIKNIFIICNS